MKGVIIDDSTNSIKKPMKPSRTLFHVNGFVDKNDKSLFIKNYLRSFAAFPDLNVSVREFPWDCGISNWTTAGAEFNAALARTETEGRRLADAVSAESGEVILSGFSLGASVVMHCLHALKSMEKIQAVFLYGAAFNAHFSPPLFPESATSLRINYFSRVWDDVLRNQFYFMTKRVAAGTEGLAQPNGFLNCSTGCTHNPGFFSNTSYSRLVPAVVELVAFQMGYRSSKVAKIPWQGPIAILNGGDWDDVYEFHSHYIQRHFLSGNYRAIGKGGLNKEICWSDELCAVLQFLEKNETTQA